MAYTVNGLRMPLRDVQMEISACWCDNPAFFTQDGDEHHHLAASSATKDSLWYAVVFPNIPLGLVDTMIDYLPGVMPSECWHYGSREDHVCETACGQRVTHSCVVVLVGCARPYSREEMVSMMDKLVQRTLKAGGLVVRQTATVPQPVVTSCPSHVTEDGDVRFRHLARWVQARVAFVAAAGKGTAVDGMKRGIVGYSAIVALLRAQFGIAAQSLVQEMVLAKQVADEEDGIVAGGFAPTLIGPTGRHETIYVETVEGGRNCPIVISE